MLNANFWSAGWRFSLIVFGNASPSSDLCLIGVKSAHHVFILLLPYLRPASPHVLLLIQFVFECLEVPRRVLSITLPPLTRHFFGLLDVLAVPRLRPFRYLLQRVIQVSHHCRPLQRELFFPGEFFLHELLSSLLLLERVFLVTLDLLVNTFKLFLGLLHCVLSHLLKSVYFGLFSVEFSLQVHKGVGHFREVLWGGQGRAEAHLHSLSHLRGMNLGRKCCFSNLLANKLSSCTIRVETSLWFCVSIIICMMVAEIDIQMNLITMLKLLANIGQLLCVT